MLKVSPGISPRFFSQKIEAKEPEKNIPCKKISHLNEAENNNLFVPNNCSTAESLKLSRVRNTGKDILILIY